MTLKPPILKWMFLSLVFPRNYIPLIPIYLESLQASGKLKEIYFDSLVEKFVEREKDFWKTKKDAQPPEEVVCLAQKRENHSQDSLRGRGDRRGQGRKNNIGIPNN